MKRAATATPERPRTQNDLNADLELAPRASSAEPIGSQEPLSVSRPIIKPKKSAPKEIGGPEPKTVSTITTEQHICPICTKTLQTDNAGLNAHIDWCLSRSAILEASASGSGSTSSKDREKNAGVSKKTGTAKKTGKESGKTVKGKNSKQDIRLAWKQLN